MSKANPRKIPLNLHVVLLVVAVILYLLPVIFFRQPSDPNYHFSNFQIILISVTVLTPWIGAWSFGVVGYTRLLSYAASIKDAEAARPFRVLARGIMVLVWGLIVVTLISSLRSQFLHNHSVVATTTILSNLIYAVTPIIGFYFIRQAVKMLNPARRSRPVINTASIITAIGLGVLAGIYIYLVFTNPNRTVALNSMTPATYYLPDWLVLLTVVVPVVMSWVLGVLVVADMLRYQKVVSGFIYRRFMRTLTYGMIIIVASSIMLQGVQALGTQRLLGSGLQAIFAVLYIFVLLELIGYVFVSHGSKKLTLIETT